VCRFGRSLPAAVIRRDARPRRPDRDRRRRRSGVLQAHFLLRVHAAAGARISLYGATRLTRLVVSATGGDAFVTRKPGSAWSMIG